MVGLSEVMIDPLADLEWKPKGLHSMSDDELLDAIKVVLVEAKKFSKERQKMLRKEHSRDSNGICIIMEQISKLLSRVEWYLDEFTHRLKGFKSML